ncbi:MAG: chromosomal replication initiator protein DnaA [Verrucomicrobiota bacterium]
MDSNPSLLWSEACQHLRETLSKDVYDRWIAVIEPKTLKGNALTITVANDFYQSWLEENYLPLIKDAVKSVTGEEMEIQLSVDRDTKMTPPDPEPEPEKPKTVARRKQPRRDQSPLNPKYSFDSFVVGPSNSFAHAATMAVAQSPARAYNPLFIYGGVGLGKTHLMQAIGNYVYQKSNANICFISCEEFTNNYIDALQKKGLVQFRNKYRNTDLLMIDDIHFLGGKERMQEEFFHTFNALFDNHKQIVMTCDRPASEIPGLEHRLVSRFEWGLVTELEAPDIETRIAILRKKQEQMNLMLPDEVIEYIAEHIRSNIRRLEGALIRSASYASLTGKELTIDMLENLLRDTLDQEQAQVVNIEMIQKAVADYFDVRLGDMTSRKRPQNIALPRQVAMYLCRSMTDKSLPSIGNAFGRNHATVLHAYRLVEDRIKTDPKIRQAVSSLTQKLGQPS